MGDDATFEAVADDVRRRWPNPEMMALSMNPDDTERRQDQIIPSSAKGLEHWVYGCGSWGKLKAKVKALTHEYKTVFLSLKAMNSLAQLPYESMPGISASYDNVFRPFDYKWRGAVPKRVDRGIFRTRYSYGLYLRSYWGALHLLECWRWTVNSAFEQVFREASFCSANYVSLRDSKSRELVVK